MLRDTFSPTTVRSDYVISLAAYEANYAQQLDAEVDLVLAAGTTAEAGRTRELGLLRAVPMARSQLRSMIRSEAMIVACLGAALGVAVAVFFGWGLVGALGDVGVDRRVFPVGQLLGLLGVATVAGLGAGVFPARPAAKVGVLDAVAGE